MYAIRLDLVRVADNHKVRDELVFVIQVEVKTILDGGTFLSREVDGKNFVDVSRDCHMIPSGAEKHSHNLSVNQFRAAIFLGG